MYTKPNSTISTRVHSINVKLCPQKEQEKTLHIKSVFVLDVSKFLSMTAKNNVQQQKALHKKSMHLHLFTQNKELAMLELQYRDL